MATFETTFTVIPFQTFEW